MNPRSRPADHEFLEGDSRVTPAVTQATARPGSAAWSAAWACCGARKGATLYQADTGCNRFHVSSIEFSPLEYQIHTNPLVSNNDSILGSAPKGH